MRVPQGAEQVVRRDQRVAALALRRVDHLEVHPHALGLRDEVVIAVEVILRRRQPDAAGAIVIVDRIIGVGCQLAIEPDRMRLEADHGLQAAKIGDLGGRMPCRSGGELVALHHHDVGPAFLGQMIQRRTSGNPAADHNDTSMVLHNGYLRTGFDAGRLATTEDAARRGHHVKEG